LEDAMDECPHSIDEMDTAIQADGICPICQRDHAIDLSAEIERLRAAIDQARKLAWSSPVECEQILTRALEQSDKAT
jgi:hypothetical protein